MITYYWYLTAYLRKHGLVLLTSLIGAIIFFSIFLPLIVQHISIKPKYYVGIVGEYSLNSLPLVVKQKLSRGLTRLNPDGSASPDLADRMSIESDNKAYRFLLKKNLVWQNGTALVPADISYDLEDTQVVTTPNDVIFKLSAPFAPFPTVVTDPLLKPGIEKYALFFKRPTLIGLGDYRLVDYNQKESRLFSVTIESQKDIYVYRFYFTENDALLAFKLGEVDKIVDITSPGDLINWTSVKFSKSLRRDRYLAVFFNQSLPIFSKNVRQALSYATDKSQLKNRALGPISPDSWAYFGGTKTYDYDLERALERILDELPNEPLKFELTTTSDFAQEAEKIKTDWESFGTKAYPACLEKKEIKDKAPCENLKIEVSLRINNYPDTDNFQALLVGQQSHPDPDQYYLWHSLEPTNFTHYKNTRIDSLLEKGRQIVDQKERTAIYQEFQQFFLEDAPAIFLRYLESYDVERK